MFYSLDGKIIFPDPGAILPWGTSDILSKVWQRAGRSQLGLRLELPEVTRRHGPWPWPRLGQRRKGGSPGRGQDRAVWWAPVPMRGDTGRASAGRGGISHHSEAGRASPRARFCSTRKVLPCRFLFLETFFYPSLADETCFLSRHVGRLMSREQNSWAGSA